MTSDYYVSKRTLRSRVASRMVTWCLLMCFLAGLVVAGYFWGKRQSTVLPPPDMVDGDYYTLYMQQKDKLSNAEQEAASLRIGAKIDDRTINQLKTSIIALKKDKSQLERDVSFYKDIMTPDLLSTNLAFGDLEVSKTEVANRFNYNLMMIKPGNDKPIKGYLEFDIIGKLNGKTKRYELRELSPTVGETKIPLSFTYFTRIKGEIVLPKGFDARTLELRAVDRTGPKTIRIKRKYAFNQ